MVPLRLPGRRTRGVPERCPAVRAAASGPVLHPVNPRRPAVCARNSAGSATVAFSKPPPARGALHSLSALDRITARLPQTGGNGSMGNYGRRKAGKRRPYSRHKNQRGPVLFKHPFADIPREQLIPALVEHAKTAKVNFQVNLDAVLGILRSYEPRQIIATLCRFWSNRRDWRRRQADPSVKGQTVLAGTRRTRSGAVLDDFAEGPVRKPAQRTSYPETLRPSPTTRRAVRRAANGCDGSRMRGRTEGRDPK